MTTFRRRSRRPVAVAMFVAATTAAFALAGSPAAGGTVALGGQDDPGLNQSLDADQPLADDEAVLDAGHVDLGPRFVDGEWRLLVHDDSAEAGSVWRHPDRTAFRVGEAGRSEVPDDPTYEFLGAAPGEPIHLIPQVQLPEVVWLGWNTQDPEVMDRIDRGVSLTLLAHVGPGRLTVYLQGGNFAEPDVLWSTEHPESSPIWVETNTHTHANWVFTEPGVHLLAIRADATLVGGDEVSDTAVVRVEVGDDTAHGSALTAKVPDGFGAEVLDVAATEEAGGAADVDEAPGSTVPTLLAVLVAAVVLLATAAVVAIRSARIRRSAS